jgi:flagellar biosynthesis/type III secretory pathway M-ring protein FliF/YscJ
VIVTMPGTVTEHNADEVRSDGTLVWKIPFTGSTEIVAASEFGSSSSSWILLIVLAVVIVGVIAAAVATIVSRRESKNAVAAAAASHQSGDDADASGPVDVEETASADDISGSGSAQDPPTIEVETEADGTDDDVNQ